MAVPEWEHISAAESKTDTAATRSPTAKFLSRKLDAILPPHRRYLRLSRKAFLLVLAGVSLLLLALIVGLAVGLTNRTKTQDLPLPSNTQTFTGDLTYYQPGLGACGETNTATQDIVAVSHVLFDAAGSSTSDGGNSNDNPLCGRRLRATRFDAQYGARRSVDLTVVDRCTGCAVDDLDTSLAAFTQLAPESLGRVDVTWAWLQPVATGA